jgi:nitroreductase
MHPTINSTAWEIDPSRLPPLAGVEAKLRFALQYAVLAPSSHNSQPWHFIVDGDSVMLCADRTRALPIVDPFDRELIISCGAVLFNLRVALQQFGLGYSIRLFPVEADPDALAHVRVLPDGPRDASIVALFDAITRRVTTRESFLDEAVPLDAQAQLVQAATAEGVDAVSIGSTLGRERLAELIAEADHIQFRDPRFRRELASWIHPRRHDDGMPAYAGGASALLDFATPLAALALRTFDLGGGLAAAHRQLVDRSPMFLCIGTGADDRDAWFAAGQALERVLLTGVTQGLTASYLNQPLEVDSLRDSVGREAGMNAHPQLLLRMGKGPHVAHSSRRAMSAVVS